MAIPARNRDLWTEVPTIFRRQAVEESVAPTEDLAWGPLGTDWSTLRGPGVRPRQLLSRTEWDTPNGSESSRFEESFGIPENTQNYHTFPTQDRPSPTNVTTHPRINEDDEPFDHGDAPLSESRHDDMAEFLTAVPTNTPYSNSLRGDVDVEEISDIQQSSNSTISAPFFEYIERATVEGISEVQQIDNEISDRLTELKLLSNTSITNLILTVVGNPDLHLTHGSIKGENATALERSEVGLGRQTSHFLPVQSDDHNDESGANTEVEVSVPEDADNQALPSPISTGNIESGGEGKYGFVPADLFRQLAYRHFLDLQLIMVVDNIEPVELYKYLRFQSRAHPARTARLYSYWATVMVFRSMLEDDIESLFNQWPQDLQDEETQWISNLQELGVHLRGNSMPSLTLEYERQMGLQIPLDLDLICLIDIKTPFEVYNILCRDNRPRAEKGVWEIMRQFTKQQQDFYIETQNVYGEVLGSPDLSSSEKGPLLAFPNYSLRIERLSRHSIPSNLGIQFLKKLQESDVFSTSRMVEEGVKFVDIFAFLRSICRAYPLFTKFEEAAAAIYGRISHEDELAYITGLPRDVQGTELEWLNNLIHGAPLSKKKVPSGLRFGLEFEYREVVLDDMDDARYPMGKAVSAMLNILSPEVPLVAVVKAARRSIEVIVRSVFPVRLVPFSVLTKVV